MSAKTPSKIHPRTLLLSPRLSPVPSVLILSSTKASTGLDTLITLAADSIEAPAPFATDEEEHLVFPPFAPKFGKPRTDEEIVVLGTVAARAMIGTSVVELMVAIGVAGVDWKGV